MAGFAGTAAMTISSTLEAKLRGRAPSSAPARATAKMLGIKEFEDGVAQARFNDLSHWRYGTSWGVLRRLLGGPGCPPGATAAHGAAIYGAAQVTLRALEMLPRRCSGRRRNRDRWVRPCGIRGGHRYRGRAITAVPTATPARAGRAPAAPPKRVLAPVAPRVEPLKVQKLFSRLDRVERSKSEVKPMREQDPRTNECHPTVDVPALEFEARHPGVVLLVDPGRVSCRSSARDSGGRRRGLSVSCLEDDDSIHGRRQHRQVDPMASRAGEVPEWLIAEVVENHLDHRLRNMADHS